MYLSCADLKRSGGCCTVVLLKLIIVLAVGCGGKKGDELSSRAASLSIDVEARSNIVCSCEGRKAAQATAADEMVVNEQEVMLTGMGCSARVVEVISRNANSTRRHVMRDPGGSLCDWQDIVVANRLALGSANRQREEARIRSLPEDWEGKAIVWIKHAPLEGSDWIEDSLDRIRFEKVQLANNGFLGKELSEKLLSSDSFPVAVLEDIGKNDLLAAISEGDVGRVVAEEEPADIVPLACISCNDFDDNFLYNINQLTSATNFGFGNSVGILEQYVYNCNGLSQYCPKLNGEFIHDDRIKDWAYAIQVARCSGLSCMFSDYHENLVASRMWTKHSSPIRNGNPISIGIGTSNFNNYLTALDFLSSHAAKVVNRSIFDGVSPWSSCASAATMQYDLLQDYFSWSHATLFVQAVANCTTDPACIRLSNSITVGGDDPTLSQTENSVFYSGGRLELPDVVGNCFSTYHVCAPKGLGHRIYRPQCPYWSCTECSAGNSLNAPTVTSIASMIQQDATSVYPFKDARWPVALRALIMAGADYTPYKDLDTSTTCAGCTRMPPLYCSPVDCKYGAGFVQGNNAWSIYQDNKYRYYQVSAEPGWAASPGDFYCPQTGGCTVKAVAAWSNAIDCDDLDCNDDGHVIHDFNLCLEARNGSFPNYWYTPVICSRSPESTSEWLQYDITSQTKYYRLRVYLVSRSVARTTDLALAWRAPGATL